MHYSRPTNRCFRSAVTGSISFTRSQRDDICEGMWTYISVITVVPIANILYLNSQVCQPVQSHDDRKDCQEFPDLFMIFDYTF